MLVTIEELRASRPLAKGDEWTLWHPMSIAIHKTATVGSGVKLGKFVKLGYKSLVGDCATINDGAAVNDYAKVGSQAWVGVKAIVGSLAVVPSGGVLEDAVSIFSNDEYVCMGVVGPLDLKMTVVYTPWDKCYKVHTTGFHGSEAVFLSTVFRNYGTGDVAQQYVTALSAAKTRLSKRST